jgi:hypothetical protein
MRRKQLEEVALAISTGICDCDGKCNGWQCHCETVPCVCAPLGCLGNAIVENDDVEVVIVLRKKGEKDYEIKL